MRRAGVLLGMALVTWVLAGGCKGTEESPRPAPHAELPAPQPDGGSGHAQDAGGPDSGLPDAGPADAGSVPDDGSPDAGQPDAGTGGLPGATLWLRHDPEPLHEVAGGVAAGAGGDVFTVATHGASSGYNTSGGDELRLVVRRISGASGAVLWSREFFVAPHPDDPSDPSHDLRQVRSLIAVAGDVVYLAGNVQGRIDFGGGPLVWTPFLVRLGTDGTYRGSTALEPGSSPMVLTADAEGHALLGLYVNPPRPPDDRCFPTEGVVVKLKPDGTQVWRSSIGGVQCQGERAEVRALAADPRGRVLVGGTFSGRLRFGEQVYELPLGRFSPYLAVLEPSGELAWFRPLARARGEIKSVGASARGTIVATGSHYAGDREGPSVIEWGGTRLEASTGQERPFLLTAEPDGAPRWAKDLAWLWRPVLAVEPTGSVIVAGTAISDAEPGKDPRNHPHLSAMRYDLSGRSQWTRLFRRGTGPADLYADEMAGVAVLPGGKGSAVLFGQFSHQADFGTGLRTPRETDLFLLRLAP